MSSEEIIDYYSQCYPDYRRFWGVEKNLSIHYGYHDRLHTGHGEALVNMNRVLAGVAKVCPGNAVLDAGCGIGGSTIWLAKSLGARVVGLNIDRMQIEVARRMAHRRGAENLACFVVGDFTKTSFPDSSFDVVWGLESICYAEDKRTFLEEAKRVLKGGGRLIVADGFLARDDMAGSEMRDVERWLSGWAVQSLASVGQFTHDLEDLGFRGIIYSDITANVMPSSKRMFATGLATYPLAKYLECIHARSKIQAGHLISIFYQHLTLRRGLWEYGIFCARK
jgi:tocopherol O-methyltransferase